MLSEVVGASEKSEDDHLVTRWCNSCRCELKEPYIRCADCENPGCTLCLVCFARGFESDRHQNDHAFELLRNDFSLWSDERWNAGEELKLLEAIDDNGLGNWGAIARCINKKSSRECEAHFWQFYLKLMSNNISRPAIGNDGGDIGDCSPIPYKGILKKESSNTPSNLQCRCDRVSDNPPRPQVDSARHGDMAGYSAPRGDFVTEFDNYAESNIKDIEFTPYENEIEQELKLSMVEMYNDRLRERARRKRVIASYGLIDVWRLSLSWQQLEDAVGKAGVRSLCAVMRLIRPDQFQMLIEMIKYEAELQDKIKRLQEYRQSGLSRISSIKLYSKLKRKREENVMKRSSFDAILQLGFNLKTNRVIAPQVEEAGKSSATNMSFQTPSRRSAPPMDVTGLPGYSKLNEKERELCSTVRLIPDAFLEYKSILLSESYRNGCLRLAQARQLIKIDVNKTRKIYDFLAKEGLICTNPLASN